MFRVAAVAALLVASVAPASPVLAAPALVVDPSSGSPGDTLDATATGFPPGGPISLWWNNTSLLKVVTADLTGHAETTFRIPRTGPGDYFVRACSTSKCPPGIIFADANVTVVPVATPTPAQTPKPTPTPSPTPATTASPVPTHVPPSASSSSGPSPSPGASVAPIESFPVAVPTTGPTPLPVAVVTPAPVPPDGRAGPNAPFPNIVALGIEVTQGMQNLDNDMPLVTGRRTYARVYLHVEGADSWGNVTGALEARRDGQQIGWIWPENVWAVARIGGGDRTNLNDSLQFRLPNSWLHGEVKLTAFVWSYFPSSPFTEESNADDNVTSVLARFRDGDPLTIHLAPLHLHRNYHPTDIERIYQPSPQGNLFAPLGDYGETDRIVSGLFRYLPIGTLSVDVIEGVITPPGHLTGGEWNLGGACGSSVAAYESGYVIVDDWTIMVEDPSGIEVGDKVVPDRPSLRIGDHGLTIEYFYPRADGTGETHHSEAWGEGPWSPVGAPVWAYPCVIETPEQHAPNHALGLHRIFYDWADEREFFVGMVHPTLPAPWGGYATNGTDSVTVLMTAGGWSGNPYWHGGAATLAHEIGHRSGLGHVPCKDEDGDGKADEIDGGGLDLTHPMTLVFPNPCRLADLDLWGWFGFDVYWDRFGVNGPTPMSHDPAAMPPARVFPFMSYLGPGWADPYHYCRLLTYYGVLCNPDALDLPWNPPNPGGGDWTPPSAAFPEPTGLPLPSGTVVDYVVLETDPNGAWTLEVLAGTSSPTDALLQQIAQQEAVESSAPSVLGRLVVRDRDGSESWSAPILDPDLAHGAVIGAGTRVLAMAVPIGLDDVAIMALSPEGAALATVDGSNEPPTIESLARSTPDGDTSPPTLTWIGSDPDGDDLAATVLYAPDGTHWQVVEGGITGSSHKIPSLDGLPKGSDERFRVVVFDGFRAASADVVAFIPGTGLSPVVSLRGVSSPTTVFPLGATVLLEASAFDREDRGMPGEAIEWQSSIDGDLGTGPELRTRDLSSGKHVITAVTHDTHGNEGRASVEVIVDPAVVQALPKPETEAAIARVFERLAAGQDPAPPGTDVKVQFPWLPVGLVLLAIVAVAAGLVASRYLRMAQPYATKTRMFTFLMDGTHDPPKPKAPLRPELPSMASEVESSSGLPEGKAPSGLSSSTSPGSGGPSASEPDTRTAASSMNAMLLDGAADAPTEALVSPDAGPGDASPPKVDEITITKPADNAAPTDSDVKLKGSKFREN